MFYMRQLWILSFVWFAMYIASLDVVVSLKSLAQDET